MITQRFVIRDSVNCCAGCLAPITDSAMTHGEKCPEVGEKIARAAEKIARRPYPVVPGQGKSRENAG